MPNTNTINNHVPSLETCKRMKELGYPQKSLFFWAKYDDGKYAVGYDDMAIPKDCAAPLASEILEQLPEAIDSQRQYELFLGKEDNSYFVGYFNAQMNVSGRFWRQEFSTNASEAAALMWIFLKQKGLI